MRRARVVLAVGAAAGVLGGSGWAAADVEARQGAGPPAVRACAERVDALLGRMTVAEKVGQMVMVLNAPAFPGFTDTEALIRDYGVGSLVSHAYFGLGAADTAAYNDSLQDAAAATRLGIPLLNAADFEAGVNILVAEGTPLPTQMGLAAARNPRDAAAAATITAAEADALGFDWTFSPLADVLTTPLNGEQGVRTFSASPTLGALLAAVQVDTFQRRGLAATAKHFPGMGGSDVNSHYALPVVSYDRETLERMHLPPFRAAIRAGVEAIMTGHIVVEAVDAELPATLSRKVTTGLLREELGFDGVIITDSMTLGAVVNGWGIGEAAVMAVQAGADIVMEIGPTIVPLLGLEAIGAAVADGTISEARVDASVRRVLSLKCRYGLLDDASVDPADAATAVGTADNVAIGAELSRRAITLVRNRGVLPFDSDDGKTTLVAGVTHPTDGVIGMPPTTFVPSLAAAAARVADGAVVTWVAESEDPTDDEIAAAVAAAAGADRIVVATYAAGALPPGQARLVDALRRTGKPLVAVATGTPYDLASYPEVDAYVAAYALSFLPAYLFSQSLLDAAVDVVFGAEPGGRLPVPIGDLYRIGHGLGYRGR